MLHSQGKGIKTISDILTAEGRVPPKKSWNTDRARRILIGEGLYSHKQWDRSAAIRAQDLLKKRIAALRAKGLTYKEIGKQLTAEKLMPDVGSMWHHQTVKDRGESASSYNQGQAMELALGFRRANHPPQKIAEDLTLRGLTPKRGGTWHPQQVRELLLLAQIPMRTK